MSLFATASLPSNYWDSFSTITLLVRVIVGATFAAHGYKHIFLGGKLAGTARWFDSLGMKPNGMIHAVLASATELACGIMMILGLLTPFAAAGYVGVLLVAAWTNHRPHGYWSDSGWEYVSILGTFAVFIASVSPGKHSLDWALGLDFAFKPFTAFAIAVVLGVASGVGLLVAFYRPDAPAASDA
ncbi:DoxX family protein [Aquihabitans sp. McL0605]|uniref:DoxX family protein n=1 Tax=Aquihabitans sp. McL0605 TaxID=3415671 RepID=UPI003CE90FFE